MPTENRSSNTEMVSVPALLAADNDRDMLEYLAEAVETQTYGCEQCGHEEPLSTFDIASDLRDYMLAYPQAPAQQPHPDPIAWMVGTAFWWTKEEAERDSAATGLPIVGLGPMTGIAPAQRHQVEPVAVLYANGTVLTKADCGDVFDICCKVETPLYTHADPAEFEQLREHFDQVVESKALDYRLLKGENDTLRTKLAERDALLREVLSDMEEIFPTGKTANKVRDYLFASAEPSAPVSFQARVEPWLMQCFGEVIAGDREERNHRFLEEALELVQALGATAVEAHQLVDYVFGRAVGEPGQEVGGVMVTLAALCLANGLDMHRLAETELARIWTKVDAIRAKQASKPQFGPLPGVYPDRKQ